MGKVKDNVQQIFDKCEALYNKLGVAGVCDHVNQQLLNDNPDYKEVKYERCPPCDADMPSLNNTCLCCGSETKPLYFTIVKQGWSKELQREEIQIHCGENGNLFLIKTNEGFIVDVYGQEGNDVVDSMAIWEDDLTADEED